MKLTTYATKKRWNSFIRPDEDEQAISHTVLNPVYLKDSPISFSKPTFYIAASNFPETNYIIMTDYEQSTGGGRIYRPEKIYYWIKDIRSDVNNRWWVDCEIDLFATWKSQILSQTAFIERSTNRFNPKIIDQAIPLKNDITYIKASGSNDNVIDQEQGCWLILVRGRAGTSSTGGGLAAYMMNETQVSNLSQALSDQTTIQSIKNIFGEVENGINSLKFIPFPISQIAVHNQEQFIQVGGVTLGQAKGYPLQAGVSFRQTYILGFGSKRGDFRDTSYATRYKLFLPGVGLIDISGEDVLASSDSICTVYAYLDVVAGVLCYTVQITADQSLTTSPIYRVGDYYANVGIDLPISAFRQGNPVAAIAGVVTMAGLAIGATVVSGGTLTAQAVGMLSGAAGAGASALYHTFHGSGTMIGGYAGANTYALGKKIELYKLINDTSVDPASIANYLGRPYYGTAQLSTLTGFCKTQHFRLRNSGYMTLDEQKFIEDTFNNTGVYITDVA